MRKRVVWFTACAAFLVVLLVFFTRGHWWLAKPSWAVFVNGRLSEESRVFQSTDRRFLVEVKANQILGLFLIDAEAEEITIPNSSEFIRLPFGRFSWKEKPLAAPYGKTGRKPNLVIRDDFIHFMFLYDHVVLMRP